MSNTNFGQSSVEHGGIVVKLMAEFETGPFWVSVENDIFDPYLIDEIHEIFPVSAPLLAEISAWNELHEQTYKEEPYGQFETEVDRNRFIEKGRHLARQIREEFPVTISVLYSGDGTIPSEAFTRND